MVNLPYKKTYQNLFIFILAGVVSHGGQKVSLNIIIVQIIYFLVLWHHWVHLEPFENRVLLKTVLGAWQCYNITVLHVNT